MSIFEESVCFFLLQSVLRPRLSSKAKTWQTNTQGAWVAMIEIEQGKEQTKQNKKKYERS